MIFAFDTETTARVYFRLQALNPVQAAAPGPIMINKEGVAA